MNDEKINFFTNSIINYINVNNEALNLPDITDWELTATNLLKMPSREFKRSKSYFSLSMTYRVSVDNDIVQEIIRRVYQHIYNKELNDKYELPLVKEKHVVKQQGEFIICFYKHSKWMDGDWAIYDNMIPNS